MYLKLKSKVVVQVLKLPSSIIFVRIMLSNLSAFSSMFWPTKSRELKYRESSWLLSFVSRVFKLKKIFFQHNKTSSERNNLVDTIFCLN